MAQYLGQVVFQEEPMVLQISKISTTKQKEDENIQEELNLFLKKNKNAVQFVIPDDAMEPRFIKGECGR